MQDNEDPRILEALRDRFRAPVPKDEIRRRIESTIRSMEGAEAGDLARRRRRRWRGPLQAVAAVAASLVLFIGGAEYGRRSSLATVPVAGLIDGAGGTAATATPEVLGLPISIQEAGSQYVTRLAQLTASSASLSPADRRIAEEVAWASLRGAATELARLSRNGEALAALILELERGWPEGRAPSTVIRF